MSTTPDTAPAASGGRRPALFDRISDRILDRRGDLYGDERERILWYEATAVTASVQLPLVMWLLAVMAWVAPPAVVPYVVVMGVAFVLPFPLAAVYVARARVRLADAPVNSSRTTLVVSLMVFWLPALIFLVAVTVGLDLRTGGLDAPGGIRDGLVGAAIGGLIGLAVASLLLAVVRRVARRRDAARPATEEEDE